VNALDLFKKARAFVLALQKYNQGGFKHEVQRA
jgi:hypothetical protein